jgi:hypothetical protein
MGMMITLSVAVSLTLVFGAALAQQTTGTIGNPPAVAPPPARPLTAGFAPKVGGSMISQSDTGLSKVAPDGVSTKEPFPAAQPPGRLTAQLPAWGSLR